MKINFQSYNYSRILEYILPAIALTFGLQLLRTFIPGLAWYLKDTVGTPTLSLIPYAFGTFFLGFLAAFLQRLFGNRTALWIGAGGLALIRLIEQVSFNPTLDFWLAIAGTGLFLNFLSIFLAQTRKQGAGGASRWVFGFVLGLAFDTALRGFFGPRDLSAVSGLIPIIIIGVLFLLIIWALWREPRAETETAADTSGNRTILLLSFGCFIALQLLFFQGQGWVEEVTGLGVPWGFLIIMLGYLAAASGSAQGFANPKSLHPLIAAGLTLYLAFAIYTAAAAGGWIILMIFLGQFFMGWSLSHIAISNSKSNQPGLWRTTLGMASGMVLFLLISFGYYVGQDIALPFPREVFPTAAAVIFGVMALVASLQNRSKTGSPQGSTAVFATFILAAVPLVYWIFLGGFPGPAQPSGFPIKVMDYNIHSAYNVAGSQDLEAIADVIEVSGADIIGLQEVSRVRLMDGSADMPAWLSQRLDMQVVFQGTEEPIWGNAILSRYPILESGSAYLPQDGTLIKRGFLWARIDVGEEQPLLFIVTHLHHLHNDPVDDQVRQAQVVDILDFWNGSEQLVLVGDLNAEPDSVEIGLLYNSGLIDSWNEIGIGPGYTDASNNPTKRIDYIWHTPDLVPTAVEVIQTEASDHLPVLATLDLTR